MREIGYEQKLYRWKQGMQLRRQCCPSLTGAVHSESCRGAWPTSRDRPLARPNAPLNPPSNGPTT